MLCAIRLDYTTDWPAVDVVHDYKFASHSSRVYAQTSNFINYENASNTGHNTGHSPEIDLILNPIETWISKITKASFCEIQSLGIFIFVALYVFYICPMIKTTRATQTAQTHSETSSNLNSIILFCAFRVSAHTTRPQTHANSMSISKPSHHIMLQNSNCALCTSAHNQTHARKENALCNYITESHNKYGEYHNELFVQQLVN